MRTRIQSVAAILLLQVNMALAVEPASPAKVPGQAPQATTPDTSTQQATPEAPAPPTNTPASASPTLGQQIQQQQQQSFAPQAPFNVPMPHSRNPIARYRASTAPELNLSNSPRLQSLIRDGKIYLSMRDAIALAIENNLDLAYFRYNFPIAQTDIQRTKSGGQANGVNASVTQSTQGGFSGSSGGGGGSGGSAAAGAGGIVTSTLGAGAAVPSFDPFLNFKGYVDHTVVQEANQFLVGTPVLRTNTIEVLSQYTQNFPLGTGIQVNYLGQRITSNSPYNAINPDLYSNFAVTISQQLLAGFGLASNERYIRIAKRNAQITEIVFKAQVVATVTQVENIYWDLVNAYEDEQITERSLGFAQKTLDDDQKQLKLNAIPAMQVMTDQSAVATAEGNLTVARASLRLNELLMKNALTKVDDPTIDEMAVIPLDLHADPDPSADKSIDDLIAEAEKKRPEVAQYQMQADVQKQALKDINSELLPTLSMYGYYAGAGTAGPANLNCDLGAECATSLPKDFPAMFQNTFNYSSPEYQVGMSLSINLRNRQVKADQFRAVLAYRQSQISSLQQQKNILFDVRNSKFALEQAQARVEAAQKARDLAQRTFDITKQEQQLGAKSSADTLLAENALAQADSALDTAQTQYEKAKVDIDRAIGETLERTGVAIDDAKSGVVGRTP
ncbi:MAG TPA: TolC family protein [Terracidiphilus sp.]|jgi:outer membrane protein TolC|nr:TolC family protein [Terracidiphilus sp.]